MAKKQKQAPESIELNMVVETTEGDLGEEDVSKPLVADVIEDQQGRVEKVVVEKGVVFKKKLKIPAERVQSVEAVSGDGQTSGKVMIDVSQAEAKELAPLGDEELSPETEDEETLLEEVEKNIPTVQGLRRMEAAHAVMRERGKDSGLDEAVEKPAPWLPGERPEQATREIEGENALSLTRPASLLRVLGPGFLAGMAGNDSSAVTAYSIDGATLGATISPYTMFWQVQGEKEEQRPGTFKQQMRIATLDIASGVISGNAVSYFIIICTSATIFMHHEQITTAADAAKALVPLVGPLAKYLFALGLIGAGLVAIPVLLASTSYAVAGTFGWPAGLSKKPWQNEGFYLILTGALVISMAIALIHLDPIKLIFWANVLSGVLAPILVIYIIVIGNNRKIMQTRRLGFITNIGLVTTALVMIIAAILLFYGLVTGQSG